MTTKISSDNIQTDTLDTLGGSPTIANVSITDSSYNVLDDTAISLDGGYIKITGTKFATGCSVVVNKTSATSVTFVSATEIRAQLPAMVAGTYVMYVINTDGSVAIRVNAITYSSTPTWVTGSTLTAGVVDESISVTFSANGASTFAVQPGSTIPTGLTLASNGLLSGTITGINEDTTYNFVVNAIDAELQDSPRSFSISIVASDPYFKNTSLLVSGVANTFVKDSSNNNYNIIPAGDAKASTFSPFLSGWSNYFDGSGDNIAVATNAVFNLGLNDFAFEAWIYPISITNTSAAIASQWGLTGDEGIWQLGLTSNNFYWTYDADSAVPAGTVTISTSGGITFNRWQHVLVTRTASGGNSLTRLFINGVLQGYNSVAAYSITSSSSPIRLGMQGYTTYRNGEPYHGYISNFRFVNGSIPTEYVTTVTTTGTTVFTPPTSPLTTTSQGATASQVELLLAQSNRFIDESSNAFNITRTGDVAIRPFSPFTESFTTNGSGFFDGTGDALSGSSWTSAGQFGTGDFTAECWVYATGAPQNNQIIWNCNAYPANTGVVLRYLGGAGTDLSVLSGATTIMTSSAGWSLNAWHHVALVRSGTTLTMYVNGVSRGSNTFTTNCSDGLQYIGRPYDTTNYAMQGYISNLRFVKGTAVYTSAFTPPTSPLTAIANTSLLTLQTDIPIDNDLILDSSGLNNTIVRNGNAMSGSFSPYSPDGSSCYFDGANDVLTLSNSAFALGTGAFCLEGWIYNTTLKNYSTMITTRPDNGAYSDAFHIGWDSGGGTSLYVGSTAYLGCPAGTIKANQWQHFVCCRDSSSAASIFVDGVRIANGTVANNFTRTLVGIGSQPTRQDETMVGYIHDVRVVKGYSVYDPTQTTLTVPTSPLTAVPGTILLTCQSSRVVDVSPYNHTITRVGDTTVTNFAPSRRQTPLSYSAYFDGTGDYLTATGNTAFNPGTQDFTIECWVHRQTTDATNRKAIATTRPVSGTLSGWVIFVETTGYVGLGGWNSAGTLVLNYVSTTNPLVNGVWTHVAVVKVGNNFTIYINGVSSGTGTASATLADGPNFYLGTEPQVTSRDWNGCISNFRIVKGTAIYTSAFTPSTTPLTTVSGTSLLLCQSPTLIDNSTNNFTVSRAGDVRPVVANPFGVTAATNKQYSAANNSGSIYLDGTGDYLNITGNMNVGTSDFTLQSWVYPTAWVEWQSVFSTRATTAANNIMLALGINQNGYPYLYSDGMQVQGSNGQVTLNQWSHLCVTRSGTTMRLFVNGTQVSANALTSQNYSYANAAIGANINGTEPLKGYISDLSLMKGQALYTAPFVPPVTPVTPIRNTVLLLNGTSGGIVDAAAQNALETVGDVRISTTVSKYGGSSMYFDGTGDYLLVPTSQTTVFTGNFTVESWIYINAHKDYNVFFDSRASAATTGGFALATNASGQVGFFTNSSFGILGGSVATGAWHHVALVRSGGTITFYVNGSSIGTSTNTNALNDGRLWIGISGPDSINPFNGYMQDIRVTNGVARYTSTFTPPTGKLIDK